MTKSDNTSTINQYHSSNKSKGPETNLAFMKIATGASIALAACTLIIALSIYWQTLNAEKLMMQGHQQIADLKEASQLKIMQNELNVKAFMAKKDQEAKNKFDKTIGAQDQVRTAANREQEDYIDTLVNLKIKIDEFDIGTYALEEAEINKHTQRLKEYQEQYDARIAELESEYLAFSKKMKSK